MGNSTDVENFVNPGANYLQGKNQKPPDPNYPYAAATQSAGSIGAAIASNQLANPDINSPLGSRTTTQSGSTSVYIPGIGNIDVPKYTQNISLSPDQQNLYNQQTGIASGLMGQASNSLGQPMDANSAQAINDKAYGAITSRLDPQWAQNEEMQKTQLANQGLAPGGEAYNNAMRVFNQGKNDAYQQANLAAIQTMPQTQQLAMQLRDQPLNEMNALKTGSQVNMPQFQGVQYPGQATGPNTLGAAQSQGQWQQGLYNSQIAQQNATNQGLMGLGSAAMFAFL